MNAIRSVNLCMVVALVAATGCRSHPQTAWPSDPADVTGQVLEVRAGGGMVGTPTTDTRVYGNIAGATGGRRLRLRVISALSKEHDPETYVILDGVTQVAWSNAAPGDDGHPDLEGAFVRVWLRNKVLSFPPSGVSGTARIIAIDSVAAAPAPR